MKAVAISDDKYDYLWNLRAHLRVMEKKAQAKMDGFRAHKNKTGRDKDLDLSKVEKLKNDLDRRFFTEDNECLFDDWS